MSDNDNRTLHSSRSNSIVESKRGNGRPNEWSFFSSSPEAQRGRKIYLATVVGGTVTILLIIFSVFSIYWGALWKTNTHAHKMVGWVVDFDRGPVGNAVISAVRRLEPSPTRMTWVIKDPSEFPGGPDDLARSVHEKHVWFAVAVNSTASSSLAQALAQPNPSYDGSFAITGYGEEARSENGFRSVIRPGFEALMQPIVARFAAQFSAQNISSLPQQQLATILNTTPQLVNRPIYYNLVNLRPFDVPVATAVTFVGLIYLLILSFMVTMISAGGRQAAGIDANLPLRQLIVLRMATPFVIYFFLSVFYSLLSLAFKTPFNRYFGSSGFVIFWMLQWVGMLALGFALEAMVTLLTVRFVPIFLVLWIIINVSVCFFPIELLPGVFRYGYATPFYNVSQGVRAIVFGTKNELGMNFGILIAWLAVSCITLPLFLAFTRRNQSKLGPAPEEDQPEAENSLQPQREEKERITSQV